MNEIDREAINIMRDGAREKLEWIQGRVGQIDYGSDDMRMERYRHFNAVGVRVSQMVTHLRAAAKAGDI